MESVHVPSSGLKRSPEQEYEPDTLPITKRTKVHSERGELSTADDTPRDESLETPAPGEKTASRKDGQKTPQAPKSKRSKEKGGKGKDYRRGTRAEPTSRDSTAPKAPRLPKRQCALLIGFCGAGYSGMQIQPDPNVRTIEGVLFNALIKIGAVSQDNADDPVKVNLGRAARTDAGVHAAGNVVSMKLITAIPDVLDLVTRINEELPPEIRLWGVTRVQNSFNARTTCDSRKYTYFFPTYLMVPPKPGSGLHQALGQYEPEIPSHSFWGDASTESAPDEDLRRKREYRIGPELVESLRVVAKKFEGTHNFHNFTVGRDFSDRSNQRHIKSIEIADPVVYGETEWISVLWHGQSFMLHQRKMMTALVLSARTSTPPQIMEELYGPRTVFIPKMPALGLLLEYPIFESYTKRIASVNENLEPSDPDFRPPIDFEAHRQAIDQFKQEHIYSRMRSIEDRDGIFDAWVRSIDAYTGSDLLYLNSKGIIPPAAVHRKGERRNNPFKEKRRFDATSFPVAGDTAKVETQEEEEEEEEVIDRAKLADMEG
ncbi:pseudouridine synthase [Amylocystis lapponica]|nr:pseudouridine synthase [Amylocystis lapponica]